MIGGWASNNKFSLMGAVRAASQMVSYEVAMGYLLLLFDDDWNIEFNCCTNNQECIGTFFTNRFPFYLLICAFAETDRTPFDLADAKVN
jgi:NADH-quinone oxidoreductase subunit H